MGVRFEELKCYPEVQGNKIGARAYIALKNLNLLSDDCASLLDYPSNYSAVLLLKILLRAREVARHHFPNCKKFPSVKSTRALAC